MAVKLHRCKNQWVKLGIHPCWRVERALMDAGIEYERVHGPVLRGNRDEHEARTGHRLYPVIEFADGSIYREESNEMARTIREGRLETTRTASG